MGSLHQKEVWHQRPTTFLSETILQPCKLLLLLFLFFHCDPPLCWPLGLVMPRYTHGKMTRYMPYLAGKYVKFALFKNLHVQYILEVYPYLIKGHSFEESKPNFIFTLTQLIYQNQNTCPTLHFNSCQNYNSMIGQQCA